MTPEQYARWKDFAFRMVNVVRNARHRSPSRAQVRANIEFFFECYMDSHDDWQRVLDWDSSEPDEFGHYYLVCDYVVELAELCIPNYWSLPYEDEHPTAYLRAKERWLDPVSCCIRAGLDVAVAPSAGVLGFTFGDVRRMYPEGVPDWVKGNTDWNAIPVMGIVPGVGFIPGEPHDPKAFDDVPDECEIWL